MKHDPPNPTTQRMPTSAADFDCQVPTMTKENKGQYRPMTSAHSPSVEKTIEANIRQRWHDLKDKKKDAFAAVLSDDNTQVWADGRGARDKATAVRNLDDWTLNSYSLSNFKVTLLGPNAVVATYRAKPQGTAGGQEFNMTLDVTEVWVKRGAEWKELRFHETEVKQE
jgi:hypothetical protein